MTTLKEFAETHKLVIDVSKRTYAGALPYRAWIKNADTKDGPILRGEMGDGQTPEEALANYAERLSLKRIVIDAGRVTRREIDVPNLERNP